MAEKVTMKIDEKAKLVTITLPLADLHESKSGKTLIVATTGGNKSCGVQYKGEDVILGVNAYIKK